MCWLYKFSQIFKYRSGTARNAYPMNEAKLLKQGQSYYEYPTVDSLKTLDFWVWRAKQTRRFIVVLRHLLHTVCPPSLMSFHDC